MLLRQQHARAGQKQHHMLPRQQSPQALLSASRVTPSGQQRVIFRVACATVKPAKPRLSYSGVAAAGASLSAVCVCARRRRRVRRRRQAN
jgi:hypothetical protein